MFGPSVKSVPGWWVSIVPMLIGVPVALTPGFGPHAEVSVAPPLLLDAVVAPPPALLLDAEVVAAPPLLLLDLLLLPQPASATSASAAINKRANRIRALAW
ncbi:MAG TPA: hypothetical protein VHW04_18555 [Solirubrobacteraceae bacterium]|jgi:hypothetical protein|nr:hypothetical protein [Solirubrobacteraceae bacterium]